MSENAKKVLALALQHKQALNQVITSINADHFPKEYRDLASIVIGLAKKRTEVTQDVLVAHLETQKYDVTARINIEKAFVECSNYKCVPGELNFYLEELKKQKADRILRDILSGYDENDEPIKIKGIVQPSIIDLLKEQKDPYTAAKRMKQAISQIEQLENKDPIIRVNLKDRWQEKLQEYQERKTDKSKAVGILTGFGPLDDMTRGLHPGEMFLFAGRPGCLAGESEIYDPISGYFHTIHDMAKERQGDVHFYNELTQQLEAKTPYDFLDQGERQAFIITTASGRKIIATANHPFLTHNGWKEVKDLSIGTAVATIKRLPEPLRIEKMPESRIRLIAHFLTKGGLTTPNYTFTNSENIIIEDCQRVVKEHGGELKYTGESCNYRVNKTAALRPIMKHFGMHGKYSYEKEVPKEIYSLSNEQLKIFIGILWSNDGSVWETTKCVSFGTASSKFTLAVRHLLLRFDINCKYVERENSGKGSFEIQITGIRDLKKFRAAFGQYLLGIKKERLEKLEKYDLSEDGNINLDMFPPSVLILVEQEKQKLGLSWKNLLGNKHNGIPFRCRSIGVSRQWLERVNKKLNSIEIKKIIDSNVYWDKIVSIVIDKKQKVYDLSIPIDSEKQEPNFVANGFVVHNSGKSICLVNAAKQMFRNGKNVLLFSLEMPFQQYEDRFMASYGNLNAKRMLLGALSQEEEARLTEKWEEVGKAPNYLEIIDFPKVNSLCIENEVARILDRFTPDIVIVDYLGIMKPNDKGSVADWEVQGRIAEELRQVGRIYGVPILSAVQLNRSKDKSADTERLSRSDIIAQTADVIAMINDKNKEDDLSDMMKVTMIKNRKGESDFEFEMYKNFETILIENVPSYKSSLAGMLETT